MFVDMKAKSLYRKIIGALFTTLFVTYYASVTIFSHTHIIEGEVITHSHIHPESHHDTLSGNHTRECITMIAKISSFHYIDFSRTFVLIPVQSLLQEKTIAETTYCVEPIYFKILSLRAPPIV